MNREVNAVISAKLDTASLEEKAAHLPEAMRELFIWLGSFCREECRGDFDILHEHFKLLGFSHDKTTWSKILRGLWNVDAAGKLTASPCLAEEKFTKAVGALRNDARRQELGGRISFVMTPTARRIFTFLDVKRAPDRINKFGVIVGETGSQKTATLDEYQRQNNHGAVVKVEAPETPSMTQFMRDLYNCYSSGTSGSYGTNKAYVLSVVNRKRTIIVENVQRLYDPRAGDRQVIFSFLQKLQEDTGCTIILTITPTFERALTSGFSKGFFEQFEGRAGGRKNFLRLPAYPEEDDVLAIAKAFGLADAARHAKVLVKVAQEPGRVRNLFETLQEAKILSGDEKLTITHIRDVLGEDGEKEEGK